MDPVLVLGSAAASGLMAELLETFDLVILDAPALTAASELVDPSPTPDLGLLVASTGRTRLGRLQDAVELLSEGGPKRLGAIITNAPASSARGSAARSWTSAVGRREAR